MRNAMTPERKLRLRKLLGYTVLGIIVAALLLPLGYWGAAKVIPGLQAYAETTEAGAGVVNPRSNYWRAVREGQQGTSKVRGQERGILIQHGGENWRQIRNAWIATIGPWVLGLMLAAITVFYLWRGRIRIDKPLSGKTVPRWSTPERVLHWYTAILFIILAITGLSLLFGRAVLIPVIGPQAFAAYAQVAIYAHNYLGLFFAVGVLLMILSWVRYNIPSRVDLEWFKQGGGLTSDTHPPAGRMNGGEKVWFWIIATVGVAVIASGFVLDFPNFGQLRGTMQSAHIIHASLGIIWIAIALGHIYIGTLGTEGAIEGMTKGRVSSEWAKQHHELWYEEVKHLETDAAETVVESGSQSGSEQPG
jgi:formate dehydrogenase subunit gamma